MPPNPSVKPLAQMNPAELCAEANFLRTSLTDMAERLSSVYSHLHTMVRRGQEGDAASAYLSVANVGKRFAGMVMQASRRSSTMEGRLILAIQRDEEEKALRVREEARKKESADRRKRASAEKADPLEALFGVVKPKIEVDPTLIDSELVSNRDPSSDLDDLYGEELV